MEDKAFVDSPIVHNTQDCFTPMDQQNSLNKGSGEEQLEVCYPYDHNPNTATIDKDAMDSYIDNHLSVSYNSKVERTSSMSRKLSLYSENIINPSSLQQRPDRYTFYTTELGAIVSRDFKDLLKTTPENQFRTISSLLIETTGWWIDIFAPTNEEMRIISKIFKIHPLTTEDVQSQESREKCEVMNHYTFISFRSFTDNCDDPYDLKAAVFYILVFKEGVLTFRFQDLPHPHNVRRRIHQLKEYIQITPEWINYALIDSITDHFAPLIRVTEMEADSIDDLVLVLNEVEQSDMLKRLGVCRNIVMQLIRLLSPKADVIKGLIKRYEEKALDSKYTLSPEALMTDHTGTRRHNDVILYLGDIQDHIITMLQSLNHCDLILGRAHRNYLGKISIELSQAGNATNAVVNRLTYFATIVVPMNLVCGLFGMNVKIPGSENTDLAWFYWIVLGMFLYAINMVYIGRRIGLL